MPQSTATPVAYSVAEVAAMLGIGRTMAYDLIYRGDLGSVTIGRRRLVTQQQLDAFVANLHEAGAA